MGWFDSLFGQKTTTENQQQGTSTTSNNAWGAIQPYMQQYLQQFSAGNIAGAQTPITPYQTAAATSQMGTAANLTPAFTTAGNVASTGISPAAISSYMSPYISNVVDATRNDFNTQNARANAGVQAQAAKMGALTGTQSAVAKNLAMESQRRQQDPIIANLYNQGYGQAANLAQADLTDAKLPKANLSGAVLSRAVLENANLSGANLRGAKLDGANLLMVDFSGANLADATLADARIDGARFTDTTLDSTIWINRQRCRPGSVGECR